MSSTQINNLPLNGRNVFDLMQLSAGAVNVTGVDFENGHDTVVNGVREDFNGFLINGVSNKGLSGGVVNMPIQDTVEEFQQLQLNMSAQYGNSAGGTVNLVTKSGTNAWHGSGWEYLRNDAFDANEFFLNQAGDPAAAHFGSTSSVVPSADRLLKTSCSSSWLMRRATLRLDASTITQESPALARRSRSGGPIPA